ncbi:MAG: PAS domain-containing protein, partial [Thermoleophilia bacterium]|nr:PAS domain-containing protein [Thermoleophilia bacterium]
NLPSACVEAFLRLGKKPAADSPEFAAEMAAVPEAPRAYVVVPVILRGEQVGAFLLGSTVFPEIPKTIESGLLDLGITISNAVSRIKAEQSRGDAVADLEAFITAAPLPVWCLDVAGRVTMWNKAAERLFGWRAKEVLGKTPPFGLQTEGLAPTVAPGATPREVTVAARDGRPIPVRLTMAPFRDVLGDASTAIVMAEDLRLEERLRELEQKLESLAGTIGQPGTPYASAAPKQGAHILIVGANAAKCAALTAILAKLGHVATVCEPGADLAAYVCTARDTGAPYAAAVVDLVVAGGPSGLDLRVRLRQCDPDLPVIICSDSAVRGYEQHGFAGALQLPLTEEQVQQVLDRVLWRGEGARPANQEC